VVRPFPNRMGIPQGCFLQKAQGNQRVLHLQSLISSEYKQVIHLTDGKAVPYSPGKQFLKTFMKQPEKPNIFQDFMYMDKREADLRKVRESWEFT